MYDQNFIAPTPPTTDNSNQIATTAFVRAALTANSLDVGVSVITGGTPNGLLYDNGGVLGNLAAMGAYTVLTNQTNAAAIPTSLSTMWLGGAPNGGAGDSTIIFAGGTMTGNLGGAIKTGATYNGTQAYVAGIFVEASFGASFAGTTFLGLQINNTNTTAGYSLTNQIGLKVNWPTAASAMNVPLWLNGNSAAQTSNVIAPVSANGTILFGTPADGVLPSIELDAYGTAIGVSYVARIASGTAASPGAVGAGTFMFNLQAYGRDNSAFSVGSQGGFSVVSANQWTTTDHSTSVRFFTTPTASTSNTEAMRIQPSGGLSVGTSTDPGIGAIIANTDLYSTNASFLVRTKATLNNGSGSGAGTLTNAPSAGNPTKWISIDDNGTTRKIPAW